MKKEKHWVVFVIDRNTDEIFRVAVFHSYDEATDYYGRTAACYPLLHRPKIVIKEIK